MRGLDPDRDGDTNGEDDEEADSFGNTSYQD